jgi:hypothetical protein
MTSSARRHFYSYAHNRNRGSDLEIELSAPIAGAEVTTLYPVFEWQANFPGATTYNVEVATDSAFTDIVLSETGIADTTWTADASLGPGPHYWRVTSDNGGTSATGTFTMLVFEFSVTTTGATQTLTLNSLGVAATQTVNVEWGDGTSNNAYTDTASRTHVYATAGTYVVRGDNAHAVTTMDLRDNKITLLSSKIRYIVNVATVVFTGLRNDGTFNSADVTDWRPSSFRLYSTPEGYGGTFNSVDVTAWRPSSFFLQSMPAGYAGTFNSADVTAWRPSLFRLDSMPAGYAGMFNSADITAWRPSTFWLYSMPAGYTGTFNSEDVTEWRPVDFRHYNMPAGYGGTFNSVDVTDWRPSIVLMRSMPAGYNFTISAGGFSAWTTTINFQMQSNALNGTQVTQILTDLYTASIVPRTPTGGTISVGGTNAAPGGTVEAPADCDTATWTGGNYAYELVNDTCAVGFNKWATVTVTT